MSPPALVLAVLLHVVAALALWWLSVNRPIVRPVEEAIEVTIEKPKPPDPPPPEPKPQPPPQPKAQPVPPPEGMPPPAEITADKRTQVAPSGDKPKDIAGAPPRSLDDPVPQPPPPVQAAERPKPPEPPPAAPPTAAPPKEPAPQVAAAEAPRPKEVLPPPEQAAPQPQPSAPAVTSVPSPAPAPPPAAQKPQPPPRPQTPPAVTPHPQALPTPQITRPQERPPAIANRNTPPSNSPFVNPADAYARALTGDNYRWQILRRLSGYRFSARLPNGEAYIVVNIVIARDGRLVGAGVVRSSGIAAVDQGALDAIRAGSPYTPLPPDIRGDSAAFTLSLTAAHVAPSY